SQIINHKQGISVETAKLFGKALDTSPEFWLNLDNQYKLKTLNSEPQEESATTKAKIRKYMPVLEIQKNRWVNISEKSAEGYKATYREIWDKEYTDITVYENTPQYAARQNREDEDYTRYYSITWHRIALNRAKKITVPKYNPKKLEKLRAEYAAYTLKHEDGVKEIQRALNEAGVKFLYQKHLTKTYLDGACFYDGKNPVIVYTARYDRMDHYWFTLAHEIAHILLHFEEVKSYYILDDLDEKVKDERELEAVAQAGKMLKYDEIILMGKPYSRYFSERNLLAISEELGVDPAVVLGRLQYEGIVDWRSRLNRYKGKVREYLI
nr:ImmA/IrrE family metallo-endopeptidase [Spirochaetaceae bacterium]